MSRTKWTFFRGDWLVRMKMKISAYNICIFIYELHIFTLGLAWHRRKQNVAHKIRGNVLFHMGIQHFHMLLAIKHM